MSCPVCKYVNNGGRPIIGKVCQDCRCNNDLMWEWYQVKTNFRELVMTFFTMWCTVKMILLMSWAAVRNSGNYDYHMMLCTQVILFTVLCVEYEGIKGVWDLYKKKRSPKTIQKMFVLKVGGAR